MKLLMALSKHQSSEWRPKVPKCDYVTPEKGHYTYCDGESVYTLNGVNYCAKHEPYPVGDSFPAE
jgi:hypothetical protein